MAANEKTVFVYADWLKHPPLLMGKLYVNNHRGKEIFSFEYSKEWLKANDLSFMLDPDLHLYEGRQYASPDKPLFGIFSDSCPDRWGRLLMKRKEAIFARKENRKPRSLSESDYLLGVFDKTRIGALRFSLEENGPFLSEGDGLAAPPWTTLRKLESASLAYEGDERGQEDEWLSQLFAPGSSLGGARPKASVMAPDGSLWIAKFPSKHDEWNSGAWEMVVHDLAARCGLSVPEAKIEAFSDNGDTFLVKRFDRIGSRRVHFSSAMALLGKTDGSGADGAGYLDIASFIKSNGAYPKQDLVELWKRIVFSMAVSNTDDHLRNHGFLLTRRSWMLSPLFDVNPNIYGNALSLSVSEEDSSMSFGLAIETAEYYGIGIPEARRIASDIQKTVSDNWCSSASKYGLGKEAISRMEPAFASEFKE